MESIVLKRLRANENWEEINGPWIHGSIPSASEQVREYYKSQMEARENVNVNETETK